MILRVFFPIGLDCKRDKKSAASFVLPTMCAIVTLNCRTNAHALQKGAEINLV